MITSLSINNFALIEKLSIDFSNGFSIITGETGAGKSILLGALGLVLGKRADLTSLKNKEEKCIIEGHFDLSNYNLQPFFTANDLDYEDQTIIRREILPSGKSRAFINDTPVNLQELQDLSLFLIDIHSQNQTRELSEENFQFEIIDAIANNKVLLSEYSVDLKNYKKQKKTLAQIKEQIATVAKEQDYTTFLLEELLSAQLETVNQSELESTLDQLTNVEIIKENLSKSLASVAGDAAWAGVTRIASAGVASGGVSAPLNSAIALRSFLRCPSRTPSFSSSRSETSANASRSIPLSSKTEAYCARPSDKSHSEMDCIEAW